MYWGSERNVQGTDMSSERKVQGTDMSSERNVQGTECQVRGMYRDRQVKCEECTRNITYMQNVQGQTLQGKS